jgi:hypothetical protein
MGAEGIIQQYGFEFIGKCNCGGSVNRKFKSKEWLIYLTRKSFKVKCNGITVATYTPVDKIEAYLQKTFPGVHTGE